MSEASRARGAQARIMRLREDLRWCLQS